MALYSGDETSQRMKIKEDDKENEKKENEKCTGFNFTIWRAIQRRAWQNSKANADLCILIAAFYSGKRATTAIQRTATSACVAANYENRF
ncbi:hypothetical protein GWI33_018967 [Rhynchophorus ferrugineus]|uniref:Uncharacterized protein n=1 Tax=Rhynchophorus ferrugineus TaxID=354439 RepID=A0A834M5Q7_RHYFE|nr:hypothetical protein GWI33_018967 [Rhynchophorus ferrugineus]